MKNFIDITYEDEDFKKTIQVKEVKNWIRKVFNELKINKSSCSIYFTKEETIKNINKKYLDKNYPTDVLSFSQVIGEKIDFINSKFLGDMVICIPYAQKQLSEKNHTILQEIYYLILHGILHLLGYDHENDDSGEMINLQNSIFYKLTGDSIE